MTVEQVIAQLRRDAAAHRAEAEVIAVKRPDAKRSAATCETTLAQVHEYWAGQLEAVLPRRCVRCGGWADADIHYIGTVDSHEFEAKEPSKV